MSWLFFKEFYKIKKNNKLEIDYNLNRLLTWNLIMGQLTKAGHKNRSYEFLMKVLVFLKQEKKTKSFKELLKRLNKLKPNILLYNKRKGTIIIELPRFLTIEQSNKKSIEWWIKLSRKRKKKNLQMLKLELKNIKYNKSDIIKKKNKIILTAETNKPFFYLLKKRK